MLREILNRHPDVWIVRETHYFDDLRTRFPGRESGPLSPAEARQCEDYFLAIGHRAYGAEADPARSAVDRQDLRREAEALGGGPDAYFQAFCRLRAAANGKRRVGEKTPRHVFRIAEILAAFPTAKIVCLLRDPRAVVASYRDWTTRSALAPEQDTPFAADRRRARRSYNVVLASLMWRAATAASLAAARSFGADRVTFAGYEKLVAEPEDSLRRLSTWLGIDYLPVMLDVPLVQSSYAASGGERGISSEPLARWRSKLSPLEVAVIQSCCARLMDELGYPLEPVRVPSRRVLAAFVAAPFAAARAGLANRRRMGRAGAYIVRRLRFTLGRPG